MFKFLQIMLMISFFPPDICFLTLLSILEWYLYHQTLISIIWQTDFELAQLFVTFCNLLTTWLVYDKGVSMKNKQTKPQIVCSSLSCWDQSWNHWKGWNHINTKWDYMLKTKCSELHNEAQCTIDVVGFVRSLIIQAKIQYTVYIRWNCMYVHYCEV